jgi:GNAT superfamily N-acetyltransferase
MMPHIIVREAVLIDAPAVAELYLASRKAFIAFAPLIHSDASINAWVRETLMPTTQVIVAEQQGFIIGIMALCKPDAIGWIDQLYLLPSAVGRGTGALLLKKAKSLLGSPIRLHTFQANQGARRFYERHGFHCVALRDGTDNEENCPDMEYEWMNE